MDEKDLQETKGWDNVEKWLAELIEQTKINSRRWFIACAILLTALVATNAYWIYVFQSYDYITQDGSGLNNYNTGNQGDVLNGTEDTPETER